jgi:hypothetical protein
MDPGIGSGQELGQLGVEVGRRGKGPPRQKGAFQIVVEPFHQALGLGVAGLQMITFAPRVPRNA